MPFASLRFGGAGLLLSGVAVLLEAHKFEALNWRQWRTTIVMGCVMSLMNGAAFVAATVMSSWVVAVLVATIPMWGFLFAVSTKRRRAGAAEYAGIAGGLIGILVLAAPGGAVHVDVRYTLLVLAGTLAWGVGSVWERGAPLPRSPLLAIGLQMMVAGVILAIIAMVGGTASSVHFAVVSSSVWEALAYTVVIGGALTFGAYMWLLEATDATIANSFGYVSPVISVFLGLGFLHEAITLRTGFSIVLIVASVVLLLAPHPVRKDAPVHVRPQ